MQHKHVAAAIELGAEGFAAACRDSGAGSGDEQYISQGLAVDTGGLITAGRHTSAVAQIQSQRSGTGEQCPHAMGTAA